MKKVTFLLNNSIYDKASVEQALIDYEHVCKGTIIDDEITVELVPKKGYEKEPLKEEFCNYVLGMMKNNGIV